MCLIWSLRKRREFDHFLSDRCNDHPMRIENEENDNLEIAKLIPDHECQMKIVLCSSCYPSMLLAWKFRWGFPTSSSWCLSGWLSSRRCSPSGSGATGTRPPPMSASPGSLPSCSSICSMTSDIVSPPYKQKLDLRTRLGQRVISTPSHEGRLHLAKIGIYRMPLKVSNSNATQVWNHTYNLTC